MPLLVSVLPSDLARTRGGGERYAFALHAALRARLDGWDSLALVGASERADAVVPEGWTALGGERAGRLPAADALPLRDLLGAVPREADVVICHQWRTRATAALRVRRRRGRLVGIDYGGGSVGGYRLARLPLPWADVGAHISAFEAARSPVRARRHVVVRGGTDPQVFSPPAREQRDLDVLMVGRFLAHKGQLLVLEALPPGARALLIGPADSEQPDYLAAVRERAAQLDVDLVHDVSDADLVAAYQRARCTVQAPVETVRRRGATPPELLGLTMLEAMACGSVPVAPATGASAEFVRDGRTGLTYVAQSTQDLRRVLSDALADPQGLAAVQRGALEEAPRWTWPAAAEALLAAL